MPRIPVEKITFDRGIESTVHGTSQEERLPNQTGLFPPEHIEQLQLDRILSMPNIDSFLADALRPKIDHRDILMPAPFQQILTDTKVYLQTLRRGGRHSRAVEELEKLLLEEEEMRDLLITYRVALLAG
jgi:type III secretion protein X